MNFFERMPKLPKFDPIPPLALISFGAAVGKTTERLNTINSAGTSKKLKGVAAEAAPQSSDATLLLDPADVMKLVRAGKIRLKAEEIENPSGDSYTYSFRSTDGKTIYFLRGVVAGAPRQEFLAALRSEKMSIAAASELPHPLEKLNKGPEASFNPPSSIVTLISSAVMIFIISRMFRDRKVDDVKRLSSLADKPTDRFTDVGGNQAVVAEMRLIVNEIVKVRSGKPTAHLPRGILLSGDPGVGKTFHARVLAGEADCPFLYANASSLVTSPYVGGGARAIESIFKQAREIRDADTQELRRSPQSNGKENGVAIVFLDEVDSIAAARGEENSARYQEDTVNMLLAEMDSVDAGRNKNIVIVAATNMADIIDPALLRPGRFKHRLHIPLPATAADRLDVLEKVSRRMCKQRKIETIDPIVLNELALMSHAASPDVLRGIVEMGIDYAISDGRGQVTRADLYEALQIELLGAKGEPSTNLERVKLVAAHEHGHAVVALACGVVPLVISMIPRGESLGRVILDSTKLMESPAMRKDLLKALLINSAGRAGEKLYLAGDGISPGVEGDYKNMWEIARQFLRAGLSEGRYAEISLDGPKGSEASKIVALCNEAIDAANAILAVLPDDLFLRLVDASINGDELIGDAAQDFYRKFIDDEMFERLRQVASEYLSPNIR